LIGTMILAVSAGSTACAGLLPLALLDMSFSFGGMSREARGRAVGSAIRAQKVSAADELVS